MAVELLEITVRYWCEDCTEYFTVEYSQLTDVEEVSGHDDCSAVCETCACTCEGCDCVAEEWCDDCGCG